MVIKRSLLTTYLRQLRDGSIAQLSILFGQYTMLPDNYGNPTRTRLLTPSRTFWLFLTQIFYQNCSCREIVSLFLSLLARNDGRTASHNTAAYCKARKRLSLRDITAIHENVVSQIGNKAGSRYLFKGRAVKVVDGSALSMPDTAENQEAWPQPSGQKQGCGFPVMRLTVLFCLATGTILSAAYASLRTGENTLFRRLWHLLDRGDVVVADRYFCSYTNLASLRQQGVDCVMRLHQRRKPGHNPVRKLGPHDVLVKWFKPKKKPDGVPPEEWVQLPDEMIVREVTSTCSRKGFRTKTMTIVTTLCDHELFLAEDFEELYLRRWKAELYLRDIKTTMGMDILHCVTPAMIEKETWMFIIAHNLIRALMIEAEIMTTISMQQFSFQGTLSTIVQWLPTLSKTVDVPLQVCPYYQLMLMYIARDRVPCRPGRQEPRAIKRRRKNYQLLSDERKTFNETPHRHKYRKQAA